MSSDDLSSKLALLREQNRAKRELQEQRFEERKEELRLQKSLSAEGQINSVEE